MKLLACIACGLVLVVGLLGIFKSASRLSDEASFFGDEKDYHGLAANYAMGHGMTMGAFEAIENYHYTSDDPASAESCIWRACARASAGWRNWRW
jgi:hypothetical protein